MSETVAVAYFFYIAVLATLHPLSGSVKLIAWFVPVVLLTVAVFESRHSRSWSKVARNWAPMALILIGYWELAWFAGPATSRWNDRFIGADRWLLNRMGLRA